MMGLCNTNFSVITTLSFVRSYFTEISPQSVLMAASSGTDWMVKVVGILNSKTYFQITSIKLELEIGRSLVRIGIAKYLPVATISLS